MRRKTKAFTLALLVGVMLTGCGVKENSQEVFAKENVDTKEAVNTEKTNDTSKKEKIIYEEVGSVFINKDKATRGSEFVDGKELQWSKWDRDEKTISISKSINIYNFKKSLLGYTKENLEANFVATKEDWSFIQVEGTGYFVRADELDKVMTIVKDKVDVTETPKKETESKPGKNTQNKNEKTFTVTNINKTMYAKQSVNLRSGPDTTYDKIGSLSTNNEVTVTGQAENGWYRISYDGGIAFVSNKYLSDNKVEVKAPDKNSNNGGGNNNGGNNGGSGNNSSNEQVTTPENPKPAPTPEPTPKPEKPSVSADTVKANLESGLRSAGLITMAEYADQLYSSGAITEDDYNLIQSTAPTYGAGWFIGYESSSGGGSAIVNTYKDYGHKYYYIEYLGQEDGQYKFKCYYS